MHPIYKNIYIYENIFQRYILHGPLFFVCLSLFVFFLFFFSSYYYDFLADELYYLHTVLTYWHTPNVFYDNVHKP